MSEYKPYTLDELQEFIEGYYRIPIPTFWTITEPDPGGMIGGGGDDYLSEDGHFVYSPLDAKRWSSEEDCKTSPEWAKYSTMFHYGSKYKVVAVNGATKQPPKLYEEEMKRILLDLISHKKVLRILYPDAKFD